tara:strand:- start:333 stop:524 length:192 start_codon:yes stop_codon:yes gene_type:complete
MIEKKTYKTIKWVLRENIKNKVNNLWTWTKGKNEEFTCIYKNYSDNLTIYTPTQLLKALEDDN